MFKVFNRGHKVQLNDSELSASTNLPTSHYRRQGSLRHSHYFDNNEEFSSLSSTKTPGGSKLNSHILNSKKYVSCENVRTIAEEYQDVIDEESEDENGIKDKLVKRYNSLTTLLMKSFRKAKIKKKKEAMLHESRLETNFEDTASTVHSESKSDNKKEKIIPINKLPRKDSSLSSDLSKTPKTVRERDKSQPSNNSTIQKPAETNKNNSTPLVSVKNKINNYLNDDEVDDDYFEKNDLKKEDIVEEEEKEDYQEDNDSVPVFLGVKIISNEFVDLKPKNNPVQNNSFGSNKSASDTLNSTTTNKNEQISKIDKEIKTPKSEAKKSQIQKSFNSTQIYDDIDISITSNTSSNKSSMNTSKNITETTKQIFNTNSKPQAPKPPSTSQLSQIPKQQPVQQQISEKPNISITKEEPVYEESCTKTRSIATVKRNKTFTEQLQDMLMERKRSSIIHKEVEKENKSELDTNSEINKKKQISNTMAKNETVMTSYESNYMHQIKEFNESSSKLIEKETYLNENLFDMTNELSFNNLTIDNNVSNNNNTNSDDFKDLVHVLARQDNEFKQKFFDCLMTKLWDTTLPYKEYIQLNKLMTALFGESYHKKNLNFPSQNNTPTVNRTNKLDAEHVVNLMKVYLESNSNSSGKTNAFNKLQQLDDLDPVYSSVDNLISTLKRRQKYDTLNLEVENFNSNIDKLIKSDLKPINLYTQTQLEKTNDPEKLKFLKGYDSNNSNESKTSLVLHLDHKEEKKLLEKYFDVSFINQPQTLNRINQQNFKVLEQQDNNSAFSRSRLRKTIGNHDLRLNNLNASTINRRPPPPPPSILSNSKQTTQIIEQNALNKISLSNVDKQNNQVYYKQTLNSTIKTSGIITSFQPPSQFIAHNPTSNNSSSSSLFNHKRNSSIGIVTQSDINKSNNLREQAIRNQYPKPPINPPPKPKLTNLPQTENKDTLQIKLSKVRSVKELFKNDDPINNTVYPKSNDYLKKQDILSASNNNKEFYINQIYDKKRSISSNDNNKLLASQQQNSEKMNLAHNPYRKSPMSLNSSIYTKKTINKEIYYPIKPVHSQQQYEIKSIQSLNEAKQIETNKYYKDQRGINNNYNHLSELISNNKCYKYDGREMKQAYY